MFFDQKIHPLNFDYADSLNVVGTAAELTGDSMQLRIKCDFHHRWLSEIKVRGH